MALNDSERELFESLYFETSAPIRQKLDAELMRLDVLDDVNKHAHYFNVLKGSAHQEIAARVRTYIEAHKRVGKYPDEADFEGFAVDLKRLVERSTEPLARRYGGPLSLGGKEFAERLVEELSAELSQFLGFAVAPLRRFMSEGKVASARTILTLKVFISYKSEDDAHNRWVKKFATDLRAAGIDAKLDKWEVRFGDSFTDYMTSMIADADVVLFIMTSRSVAAVEAPKGEGGAVKFEIQMATSRRTAGETMRLIGIYREGTTAAHLRDHKYSDFRDDSQYEPRLQELVDDLIGKEKRPPLGTRTDRTDVRDVVALSLEAQRLLWQASLDPHGLILKVATFGGLTVETNGQSFAERGNPRSEAKWRSVIQELVGRGYIEQRDQEGQLFAVTNAGYDHLTDQANESSADTEMERLERAKDHVETRLRKRRGHRASLEAIRIEVDETYSDDFLKKLIELNPMRFARCILKRGNKPGITLVEIEPKSTKPVSPVDPTKQATN